MELHEKPVRASQCSRQGRVADPVSVTLAVMFLSFVYAGQKGFFTLKHKAQFKI